MTSRRKARTSAGRLDCPAEVVERRGSVRPFTTSPHPGAGPAVTSGESTGLFQLRKVPPDRRAAGDSMTPAPDGAIRSLCSVTNATNRETTP